ncbi:hypothetical protein CDD80_7537 [Ophiocordyceps camponoti-rufipedis]|uniref:Amidase domain-containing protein n=1 Tax=Ophiocordyceps camponoti-rufipedis TaxID=2004952 RepID=A0A2C5ZD66_9HYPO|nr:hypothetical protein CDD80_7537 [Ophiocordyceps camponoti-rufipedis]
MTVNGHESWQRVAERVQTERAAAIPPKWSIPPAKLNELRRSTTRPLDLLPSLIPHHELQITGLDALELAAAIRQGRYSCLQVAEAYCHQAAIAQQLTNCLSDMFFAEALERARQLDRQREETGETVGPLHGVPVSIKDHIDVKGRRSYAGLVCNADQAVRERDALVVDILRKAGAVLYVKTTNPQTLMVLETVSNLHGRTLNPWNSALGAGGSSGGEGALAALHGTALGVGTDIGGSVRVPGAFNGVYALKPSGNRVPISGLECSMKGFESICGTAGPLGRSVADLELFMRVVLGAEPWLVDPLLAMPWRSLTEEMRVLDFEPYHHKRAWDDIILPLYFSDGAVMTKKALAKGNEPMLPAARRLIEDPIVRELSVEETWALNIARDDYRAEYLERWASTASKSPSGKPMDVLICPPCGSQSTPHDVKPWWGYTALWNLLDYPAGVLPAGKVLASDAYPEGYAPVNELDRENMTIYDNALYLGMPVAVQVVGRRHEDERVVGAMQVIDDVLRA